ncbi:MAG: VCBS repeat-containing protein [Candidatus Tectomicrobia bacterium]|uniref:VCBS repeat-containing protein n=1 Tax=Tectimicrobiota bacterium TaxID=2528274 RepID=A0A932GRH2_UNCTE|nr:VCBS repeat-containing protein [Candidatus Tectomicrobia bacterium]
MKAKRSVLILVLVLSLGFNLPLETGAQSSSSRDPVDRVAGKIREAFPVVRGAVVSWQENRVILDVARKDGVQPGTQVTLTREGAEFKHPLTGVVLGRYEETLGTLQVVEVQDQYSIAVPKEMKPGTVPKVGDKVRISAELVKLAVAPVSAPEGQNVDGEALGRALGESLKGTGRFEVTDSDRFHTWLLERGIDPSQVLTDKNLQQIVRQYGIDYLVTGSVRKVQERWALEVSVVSVSTKEPKLVENALLSDVPTRLAGRSVRDRLSGARAARINPQFLLRDRARGVVGSQGLLRSAPIEHAVRGIDVGDVDGDGKNEIVAIGSDVMTIYRWNDKKLVEVATYKGGSGSSFLNVGVADLNGNGVEEIFVTNLRNNLLRSIVLGYRGGALKVVQNDIHRYLRVVKLPGAKPELWAQAQGSTSPFDGKITRYRWEGKKYVEGDPVELPKDFPALGISIYGFLPLDLDGDGKLKYIMVDNNDRLRVYSQDGELLWRSTEHYGGYETGFLVEARGTELPNASLGSNDQVRRVLIKGRILWGGKTGPLAGTVLMNTNIPSTGYILENLRGYDQSVISGLRWEAGGLYEEWRTRPLGGYMADYLLADIDNDGIPELVAAIVEPQGILFLRREGKSWIGAFKLSGATP